MKIHLDNYREIEDRIMAVILESFGLHDLTPEENASWKQIDDDMLRGELREMIVSTRELPPILLASVPDFAEHRTGKLRKHFLRKRMTYLNCSGNNIHLLTRIVLHTPGGRYVPDTKYTDR